MKLIRNEDFSKVSPYSRRAGLFSDRGTRLVDGANEIGIGNLRRKARRIDWFGRRPGKPTGSARQKQTSEQHDNAKSSPPPLAVARWVELVGRIIHGPET